MILAADRRAYALDLFLSSQERQVSFYSVIVQTIRNQIQSTPLGKVVMATSGNGRSSQFYMPKWVDTLTPDDMRHLFAMLWDLYREIYKWLVCNGSNLNPPIIVAFPINLAISTNDQWIFDKMMESKQMQAITETYSDWSTFMLQNLLPENRLEEGLFTW
jgi:hypothetical protein